MTHFAYEGTVWIATMGTQIILGYPGAFPGVKAMSRPEGGGLD